MDLERCVKLCNFSHFISLCYSQSVSSKLLNGKEKEKTPGPLGELREIIFAFYSQPWQVESQRNELDGGSFKSEKFWEKDRKTNSMPGICSRQGRKIWEIGPGGWTERRPKEIPWQLRIQWFLELNTWILSIIKTQYIFVNVYFVYLSVCVSAVVWSSQKNTVCIVTPL